MFVYGFTNEDGSVPLPEKVEIEEINRQRSATLRGQGRGIQKVDIISEFDETILIEFCYTYILAPLSSLRTPSRTALAREALRQGMDYFAGTNVVTYGVVALHDDDILEDLHNVIDKDPLQLEPREPKEISDIIKNPGVLQKTLQSLGDISRVSLFLFWLGVILRSQGLEIDALVNRRTEVVKLVVPLQGISRSHPLLGVIPEDAAREAQGWGLTEPADLSTATLAGLKRERGVDVLPRGHVVYVKQRLVLLDLVLRLVEVLQATVELILAAITQQDSREDMPQFNQQASQKTNTANLVTSVSAMKAATTSDYQVAFKSLGENDRQLIRATIQQPVVQELLLQTMVSATPALAKGARSQAFLDQVAVVSSEQPAAISDPKERQAIALGQVADAWAAEYPDAQVLQLLAVVQPAEQTLELVKRLGTAPGPIAGPSVADELELKPPNRFESNTERMLFAGVRERLEKRPINDLALDLPEGSLPYSALVASLTVGDVLARSPQEAAKLLGGADKLDAVTKAFLSDRQAALEASSGLADGVPAALVAKVETEVAAGKKPDEVLDQLKKEEEAKPEPERDKALLRNLANATTLLRVSGNRVETLEALRRRPEG